MTNSNHFSQVLAAVNQTVRSYGARMTVKVLALNTFECWICAYGKRFPLRVSAAPTSTVLSLDSCDIQGRGMDGYQGAVSAKLFSILEDAAA